MSLLRNAALLTLLLLTATHALLAQPKKWKKEVKKFQRELNLHYKNPDDSPLTDEDRASFKHHNFHPISKKHVILAKWVRTPEEPVFDMPTVSGKTKPFKKYGELHFSLDCKQLKVNAYQNQNNLDDPEWGDYLFIPFKDISSGAESYGGGRYIDLKIPQGEEVYLDFNQCYNPYCAYSTGWNCPIPPEENTLDVKILAGVAAWDDGH